MRRLLAVLVVAFFVGAVGCKPTYPKCSSDEHCAEHNEVCVEGQCRQCATDAQCKDGFVCEGNICVPKPECARDSDCGTGKKCRVGKCVTYECSQDKDCAGGSRCIQNRCVAGGCQTNEDCGTGQECRAGVCVNKSADKCSFEPVRFAFNESSLTSDAQQRLRALADCLKGQKMNVTLEGHADERGTEEYNLQLSNRRAASVKKYLTDLGVSSGNLETVGFGENRPAVQGSSEEAWAANRRVEFKK